MTFWYKLTILAVIVALYTAAVWQVKGWKDELATEADLTSQEALLAGRCKDNQAITKGADDALSTNLSAITSRLGADGVQPQACVVVSAPSTANAPAGGGKPARPVRLSTQWLRRYGAQCEEYRQERVILEKFITETWKANGQ